ncbi:MAG: galactose-1-phosphate uridylyltransferase [Candidatus Desulforudis sp.]|nr:galactose-1-phosphate uridylyltransferase [Desulforudis sp.]
MPEWRKDPIADRWVVVAPERSKRPSDFRVPRRDRKEPGRCPLCPGHEADTPPEVLAYGDPARPSDTPGWRVRVVPNKFPAVRDLPPETGRRGLYEWQSGAGRHEVVVETPDHVPDLDGQSPGQVTDVLRAWAERSRELRRDPRWRYVQVLKNTGWSAGASLEHTHSQIIAIPFVPAALNRELAGMEAYQQATGRCVLCDAVSQELTNRRRLVHDGGSFVAFTPFAARFPAEVWIAPREHAPDFAALGTALLRALADTLLAVLRGLSRALGAPPYNLVLHTAPAGDDRAAYFHWHLEISPRLIITAGFELGTGYYVNPLPPEEAAAWLRRANETREERS